MGPKQKVEEEMEMKVIKGNSLIYGCPNLLFFMLHYLPLNPKILFIFEILI